MGLFSKVKNIFFDEEEYTEQIKITPEMRNEMAPAKDENRSNNVNNVNSDTPTSNINIVNGFQNEKSNISFEEKKSNFREEIPKKEVKPIKAQLVSERELFKTNPGSPFLDFDEEEFDNQKSEIPTPVAKPDSKVGMTNLKKSSNVIEYEKRRRIEKRSNFGKYEKTEINESVERKKFRPSPIISPVYGVLNKDYIKDDIVQKDDKIDVQSVRDKAFGEKEEIVNHIEDEKPKKVYYEETDTVTISNPLEKEQKVKTIDELLENTTDTVIDVDHNLDSELEEIQNKVNDLKEKTQEIKIPEVDDTLENDLFDLIDSMYDNKEDES